jgi:two-component system, NarL family, response regulator NreC
MLRLVLADDHGVLRAGLRALLGAQPDFEVVGEAESAEELEHLVSTLQPDVAVVDVRMPGGGLNAVRRIKHDRSNLRVLVLSQYDDPAYLREALAAGASGYALKRSAGQELIEAIRAVGRGEAYLHPSLTRVLVEASWGPLARTLDPKSEPLSEREVQVPRLVARGYTAEEIADKLLIGVRTVKTYKTRTMEKLGLSGRAALVDYAVEHGLLEGGPE